MNLFLQIFKSYIHKLSRGLPSFLNDLEVCEETMWFSMFYDVLRRETVLFSCFIVRPSAVWIRRMHMVVHHRAL